MTTQTTSAPQILTSRLNHWGNFSLVLASKKYSDKPMAITYANRTQAGKRAESLKAQGVDCYVFGNQPFYVGIVEEKTQAQKKAEWMNS